MPRTRSTSMLYALGSWERQWYGPRWKMRVSTSSCTTRVRGHIWALQRILGRQCYFFLVMLRVGQLVLYWMLTVDIVLSRLLYSNLLEALSGSALTGDRFKYQNNRDSKVVQTYSYKSWCASSHHQSYRTTALLFLKWGKLDKTWLCHKIKQINDIRLPLWKWLASMLCFMRRYIQPQRPSQNWLDPSSPPTHKKESIGSTQSFFECSPASFLLLRSDLPEIDSPPIIH